ncbi:hypothetical protein DVH24_029375 [Malus domestica]|uniref:RNase H type-1 domain-containing protein n=1 Tax=Malus domestica TaxID=3750 RepID=A0A498HWX7_MALDO|nr:hypothetical protein DVH24_029375 [Malus domestica]
MERVDCVRMQEGWRGVGHHGKEYKEGDRCVEETNIGCWKVNCDGGRGGVRAASSLAIEAMKVKEALWACVEKGYQQVILESDSLNLISMLNGKEIYDAANESLIFDVRELAKHLRAVEYGWA